jgi:tight adherence protein B
MLIALLCAALIVAVVPRLRSRRWPIPRRRIPGPGPGDEVALLNGLAAELRAGASLRAALVAGAERAPQLDLGRAVRAAGAGQPMSEVAAELSGVLPINGRLVAAAFRLTAASGGRAAAVFEELALRAAEAGELSRERRALTAQARLSAFVVSALPVAMVGVLLITGKAQALLAAGPVGHAIAAVGVGLELVGLAVVATVLRNAERAP